MHPPPSPISHYPAMDYPPNPLLSWNYYSHRKGMDELKQSLLMARMELETARLKAHEELKIKDEQLSQLRDLLNRAIKERDEAREKCQRLLFEKHLFQQQQQQQKGGPLSGVSSVEDEAIRGLESNNNVFSSSDSDESIVSSPILNPIPPPPVKELALPVAIDKPLPEKGKLLQAVMKAGPLLQTLLLAGPLPQWRHPPPQLDSYQIPPPPVVLPSPPKSPTPLIRQDPLLQIASLDDDDDNNNNNNVNDCGILDRKRTFCEVSYSSVETKYKRVFSH